jgi:hypothetical protein
LLNSQGYNLIEDTTDCTFTPTTGDITGSDPGLGALADNGGSTWTHALGTGSPAIDEIPDGTNGCVGGTSVDQRGAVRADGAGRGGSACDIGAYEDSDETPTAVELQRIAIASPWLLALMMSAVLVLSCVGGFVIRRRRCSTL